MSLLLTACATSSGGLMREGDAATFQTDKSLAALEKCLTDKLSTVAEVTAVNTGAETTLMLGERANPTMMIDLAPPRVAVTTKIAYGTKPLIEACL